MGKDSQSRKWQLTINNPTEKRFTHDIIKQLLGDFKSLTYWCMADEVGEKGTYHTHIYLAFKNPCKFSTLKNKFDGAHFEMAKGTSEQNRDYVFKMGKWETDKKKETNLADTQEEYGECPLERQGCRNDIHDLYAMIKEGMSDYEILEENPDYMLQLDKIDKVRQTHREESYRREFRNLEVSYVYGVTGTGKTRSIMERYGYENVYRVTDYDHPFDSYRGQDVLLFEEFKNSVRIQDMLLYLDGYPLELPCRYLNKIACFTKVYITSNLGLNQQYPSVQVESPAVYDALLRRIQTVTEYTKEDQHNYTMSEYLHYVDGWHRTENTPFIRQERLSL